VPVRGVPNLVGDASAVQQPKEGIDEQVEQERGEDQALDGSRIQLDGCCAFPTHLHPLLINQTSGTPNPSSIIHRHEWLAELKAFLKSRSIRISVPPFFIASCISQLAF